MLLVLGLWAALAVAPPPRVYTPARRVQLRTLCQMARVYGSLHGACDQLTMAGGGESVAPAELQPLSSTLVRDSVLLARSLRALSALPSPSSPPLPRPPSLDELKAEATALHAEVVKQEAQLAMLEEEAEITSSKNRAREMFDLLDSDKDGSINLEEFVERATLITPLPQQKRCAESEASAPKQDQTRPDQTQTKLRAHS